MEILVDLLSFTCLGTELLFSVVLVFLSVAIIIFKLLSFKNSESYICANWGTKQHTSIIANTNLKTKHTIDIQGVYQGYPSVSVSSSLDLSLTFSYSLRYFNVPIIAIRKYCK